MQVTIVPNDPDWRYSTAPSTTVNLNVAHTEHHPDPSTVLPHNDCPLSWQLDSVRVSVERTFYAADTRWCSPRMARELSSA